MAWIELHQTLPQHRKILKLKSILGIETPQAIGHLCMLWLWSLDNAEDGDLSELDSSAVAEVAGYTKKNHKDFLDALVAAGFVTEDLHLHDWHDYTGKLMERRESERNYRQRQNALYSDMRLIKAVRARDGDTCQYCGVTVNWKDRRGNTGGTYDRIDPDGENVVDNIAVACRSCNTKKDGRNMADSGLSFIDNSPLWQVYGRFMVDKRQVYGSNYLLLPYRTYTVPNIYSGGGDARAREEGKTEFSGNEDANVGKCVENYVENVLETATQHKQTLKEINGLTVDIKERFRKTVDLLFEQYFGKQAQEYDYTIVFRLIRWVHIDVESGILNPPVEMSEDDIELLTNAFDAAAMADKKSLAYVQGVIKRYRERGIQTADAFWEHEVQRNERSKQAAENRRKG